MEIVKGSVNIIPIFTVDPFGSRLPNYGLLSGPGTARDRPSPYGNRAASSVGQDRLKLWQTRQAILTRSGAGAPELRSTVKGGRFLS